VFPFPGTLSPRVLFTTTHPQYRTIFSILTHGASLIGQPGTGSSRRQDMEFVRAHLLGVGTEAIMASCSRRDLVG